MDHPPSAAPSRRFEPRVVADRNLTVWPDGQHWREAVIRGQYGLECRLDRHLPFAATLTSWPLGAVRVARMRLAGHAVAADRAFAHKRAQDHVFLKLVLSGKVCFESGHESLTVGCGSLTLVDPAREFVETFVESTDLIVLNLPRHELQARGFVAAVDRPASQDGANPDVVALRQMVQALALCPETASESLRARIGGQLLDLMDVLVEQPGAAPLNRTGAATLQRIKHFVSRRLGDTELDAAGIAAAMRLSVRHINRLFRAERTSLMRFLWARRLERARELVIAGDAGLSIEQIAWRCGFSGASQFSRAFKRQYGCAPRDLRHDLRRVQRED